MKNYQEAKASDEVIKSILAMKPIEISTTNITTQKSLENVGFDKVTFGYS